MTPTASDKATPEQPRQSAPPLGRFLIVMAIGVAATHAIVAVWRATHADSDLISFHHTVVHWWRTGQLTGEFGVWFYVPAFVPLIAPIAAWPLPIAGLLMATVNMVLLASSIRTCSTLAARGERLPAGLFWAWPLLLVLPFASGTIQLGQVNLIVLWLCVAAYSQAITGRQGRAGFLIALAGILKLYPLILAVYWLLKGRWRIAFSAGLAFVTIAGGLSLAAFGWQGSIDAHRYWWHAVRQGDYRVTTTDAPTDTLTESPPPAGGLVFGDRPSELHRYNNQSLAAVTRRLTTDLNADNGNRHRPHLLSLPPTQSQWIYRAAAALIAVALAQTAWRRRRQPPDLRECAAWLAAVMAFVPVWWTHYFVLLLPAVTCLGVTVWRHEQQGRRSPAAEILQACWLISLPLLAWPTFRWLGGNAWLTLAVMAWLLWSAVGPGTAAISREVALHTGLGPTDATETD